MDPQTFAIHCAMLRKIRDCADARHNAECTLTKLEAALLLAHVQRVEDLLLEVGVSVRKEWDEAAA